MLRKSVEIDSFEKNIVKFEGINLHKNINGVHI